MYTESKHSSSTLAHIVCTLDFVCLMVHLWYSRWRKLLCSKIRTNCEIVLIQTGSKLCNFICIIGHLLATFICKVFNVYLCKLTVSFLRILSMDYKLHVFFNKVQCEMFTKIYMQMLLCSVILDLNGCVDSCKFYDRKCVL